MRLPTVTAGQRRSEDAREFHERLWRAAQTSARIAVFTDDGYRMWSGVHQFWTRRGYILKSHLSADKFTLELWLEPRVSSKAVA